MDGGNCVRFERQCAAGIPRLRDRRRRAVLTWALFVAWCAIGLVAWPGAQQPPRPPDIYFTGTPQPVVYQMLKLAAVGSSDIVYDLGSGDGRILVIAAQTYGARGVGIEIQP